MVNKQHCDDQLDLLEGIKRKREGMERAAKHKSPLLEKARMVAVTIGRKQRYVTADDVRRHMAEASMSMEELGNAAGSLFRTKDWRFTGRRVKSKYVANHAKEVNVWEYIGD